MSSDKSLTFSQTVRGVTEFIEVAIHTICYVRQLYPADMFVRRKKYDTPVYQSRFPDLNTYISDAVKAVREELVTGNVEKVVMVIKDKEQVPLERFVFGITEMIKVDGFDKESSVENAMTLKALSQAFRSFLVKLTMVETQIGQMSFEDDLTFAIILELKDETTPVSAAKNDVPPWVPAEKKHTTSGASPDAELSVIRTVDTGVFSLSLSIQESPEKLRNMQEQQNGYVSAPPKGKGKERAP